MHIPRMPLPQCCDREIKPRTQEQRMRALDRALEILHDEFARIHQDEYAKEHNLEFLEDLWHAILVAENLRLGIVVNLYQHRWDEEEKTESSAPDKAKADILE